MLSNFHYSLSLCKWNFTSMVIKQSYICKQESQPNDCNGSAHEAKSKGCLKKSGQIFWFLQQKQLFLEQKYTWDGQNYASKGLIWDIAHLCGSKTFGDMIENVKKSFFKKLSFCNFFFQKKWTCILTSTAKKHNS